MFRAHLAPALAAWVLLAPPAAAQTWTGVANGNWNNSINWSPAGVPASGVNTQLTFDTASITATGGGDLDSNDLVPNSGTRAPARP